MTADGQVAPNFAWHAPEDERDPAELLLAEGVVMPDGLADPTYRLSSDDLVALVETDVDT